MTETNQNPQDVHYFWPEERIDALRMYARDDSEPADKFALSKRIAWMREFCIDAPTWLQTFEARERLRNKAEAARSSIAAAAGQIDLLLQDINALGAAANPAQDRWAAAVTSKVEALPTKPRRAPEVIGEADAPDPDKPKTQPKAPAPGEKLPSELLWDAAHGKKPRLRDELNKMKPETLKRLNIPEVPAAEAEAYTEGDAESDAELAESMPPLQGRQPLTQDEAIAANKRLFAQQRLEAVQALSAAAPDEDYQVVANPDDEAPDEAPRQPKGKKVPVKTAADFLVERQAKDAPAKPAPRAATVKVKRADGSEQLRAPRTGFRMELDTVAEAHGDEVATFVAHNILKDSVNVRMIRRAMGKFKGTFKTRDEAALNCAEELDQVDDYQKDVDVLRKHAGYTLEHEDGRCSWWRK